ncbi:MAG TPA: lysylphosphatidylglycerol synthase domain-containing protein [Caulobacteraceae bacterium]|nr:lysylphosphatidylglycerol synthase domain-containing protein [Caulobacteraceae bacterium]
MVVAMMPTRRYRIRPQRAASLAFLLFGLAAFFWILHDNDYRAVLNLVMRIGGGLVIIVALRGAILMLCGLAWWRVLQSVSAAPARVMIWLRTVGEAFNVLLPVAAVGGDIVRAVLLKSHGVDGGAAAASTLVDVLLQAAAQALFVLIGAALLLLFAGKAGLAWWAVGGAGVAALALGGFYAVQRFGGARLLERGLAWLASRWQTAAAGAAIRLDAPLQAIYADRRALGAALSLHELAWLVGALETWIALRLMGMPVSASTALILESLNQGLRSAAFPVPSGLGVQEGGYIALGAVFGIPPQAALALSLAKRAPDLAIGLPSLLAFYLVQIRRLLPARS